MRLGGAIPGLDCHVHRAYSGAALATARPARAADEDPWWGRDKALHFGVSAGSRRVGLRAFEPGVRLAARTRSRREPHFPLTLGAGKELYNLSGGGDASWKDFTWDVAGTSVGVGLALLVDLIVTPKSTGSSSRTTGIVVHF